MTPLPALERATAGHSQEEREEILANLSYSEALELSKATTGGYGNNSSGEVEGSGDVEGSDEVEGGDEVEGSGEVEGSADDDYDYGSPYYPHTKEQHDDHMDDIDFVSPWKDYWDCANDWVSAFVYLHDESIPNSQLYQNKTTQKWLQKLSSLRQPEILLLNKLYGPPYTEPPLVPLFKDTNGNEYQIQLDLESGLARTICPLNQLGADNASQHALRLRCQWPLATADKQVPSAPKFGGQFRSRLSRLLRPSPTTNDQPPPTIPEIVFPLGTLQVRTTTRRPWLWDETYPLTEKTDYCVMLDAGSADMPLWLLASRKQLRDRMREDGWKIPPIPIFKGLMDDGEYGYDTACIMSSIHKIALQKPGKEAFNEACELVRMTRAVADPRSIAVHKDIEIEIAGHQPPPEDFADPEFTTSSPS